MNWQEQGSISEVFWTTDSKFSFQRVGNYWRLYHGEIGEFLKEFRSFVAMQEFIRDMRNKAEPGR